MRIYFEIPTSAQYAAGIASFLKYLSGLKTRRIRSFNIGKKKIVIEIKG